MTERDKMHVLPLRGSSWRSPFSCPSTVKVESHPSAAARALERVDVEDPVVHPLGTVAPLREVFPRERGTPSGADPSAGCVALRDAPSVVSSFATGEGSVYCPRPHSRGKTSRSSAPHWECGTEANTRVA
jgi:hypothetical protein